MRFTQSEKMEIIRLVRGSQIGVKRTLEELDVPRRFTAGTSVTGKKAMTGWPTGHQPAGASGTKYPIVRSSG